MWSEVLQMQDREVVGSCGSRVFGGANGLALVTALWSNGWK